MAERFRIPILTAWTSIDYFRSEVLAHFQGLFIIQGGEVQLSLSKRMQIMCKQNKRKSVDWRKMFFEVLLWHGNLDNESVEQTPSETHDTCDSRKIFCCKAAILETDLLLWKEVLQLPDIKRSALLSKLLHYSTSDWSNFKIIVWIANQKGAFFTSKNNTNASGTRR